MPLLEGLTSGVLAEVGEGPAAPIHVTGKSMPYQDAESKGKGGHYKLYATTGQMAAAQWGAGNELFRFRWHGGNFAKGDFFRQEKYCVITKIKVCCMVGTTLFAAGGVHARISLSKCRHWIDFGTPGGTTITIGDSCKSRSDMARSLQPEIAIASTTVLAVTGSKFTEASAIAALAGAFPITASTQPTVIIPWTTLYSASAFHNGFHPLHLTATPYLRSRSSTLTADGVHGSGFLIAVDQNAPATGVFQFAFQIEWAELPFGSY